MSSRVDTTKVHNPHDDEHLTRNEVCCVCLDASVMLQGTDGKEGECNGPIRRGTPYRDEALLVGPWDHQQPVGWKEKRHSASEEDNSSESMVGLEAQDLRKDVLNASSAQSSALLSMTVPQDSSSARVSINSRMGQQQGKFTFRIALGILGFALVLTTSLIAVFVPDRGSTTGSGTPASVSDPGGFGGIGGFGGGDASPSIGIDLAIALETLLQYDETLFERLQQEGTPEYLAWRWLEEQDALIREWQQQQPQQEDVPSWKVAQRYLVVLLYFVTNGPSWVSAVAFLSAQEDVCDWKVKTSSDVVGLEHTTISQNGWLGITACNTEGRITDIHLPASGLQGPLPPSLANLSWLEVLDLSGNHVTGTLPVSLGRLTRLQHLNLAYNALTGTLPFEYGNWKAMERVVLSRNRLVGTLPQDYTKWTEIRHWDASHNRLSGTLPSSWTQWRQIQHYDIGYNRVTGTIPLAYRQWSQLIQIHLAGNALTGSLPNELAALWTTHLRWFDVAANRLTGALPSEYGLQMMQVRHVSLWSNQFTGTLPQSWSRWSQLEHLDLSGNALAGTLLSAYGQWTQLKRIWFSNNALTGSVPSVYSSWATSIEIVGLGSNQLTGTLPQDFIAWKNLRTIDLSRNALSGKLPLVYREWSKLQTFSIAQNQLTGTLPSGYGDWSQTTAISFGGNQITGTLPSSFVSWEHVREASFAGNHLMGTLPNAYHRWTNVESVSFADNYFQGTFPPLWEEWTIIQLANFSHNCLDGHIPKPYRQKWDQLATTFGRALGRQGQNDRCSDPVEI